MAIGTYDELKNKIESTLDRDDLVDDIPDFILLAEEDHADRIRIREMLARSQATLNDETGRYIAVPPRFVEMETLRLLTTPRITKVKYCNLATMDELRQETPGRPSRFTVHEEVEFDRPPDTEYTAEMIFYASPTPLSEENQSNVLLVRSPGAYLYGSLLHAAPFLDNDERIPTWRDFYEGIVDRLNMATQRARHSGPLLSRVAGATP
ncbi:phage adaptor protein [Methyloceanibacter caenitepidi]|uniref:Constituent protein n=1 Tax=Methyloceanibacter caenitepidi TaxID=1384459 RepID=A0A0A8K4K2_9HYPH|nr:hypothetical protein [Methyloceanibacter caenitepidi]BAQ16909.1 constituent protein [Methyloceanibacter caenitepidi]